MDHSNGLVWKRSVSAPDCDDVWDDRALIDAYDKAVKEVNRRIADKRMESNDKTVTTGTAAKPNDKAIDHSWNLGQYCRCAYSEDGVEYEAQIISINTSNDTCFVRYVGYGNEEQKPLKELKPSMGKRYRKIQSQQLDGQEVGNSGSDDNDNITTNKSSSNESKHKTKTPNNSRDVFMPSGSHIEPMIPPPFPSVSDSNLPSDDESLASMLMSWYMSGYHTGYYRALKECRHLCNK